MVIFNIGVKYKTTKITDDTKKYTAVFNLIDLPNGIPAN